MRKEDHINLALNQPQAFQSKLETLYLNYEPLFGNHQQKLEASGKWRELGIKRPLWISSMTGGAQKAQIINQAAAKACEKYGLGMGLGSCRALLGLSKENALWRDFAVKEFMPSTPLFANLGVAQIEELIQKQQVELISELCENLQATGLVIHVNPIQEYIQPEGDRYQRNAAETIEDILNKVSLPIIVKEVGHGFGPKSIKFLLQLSRKYPHLLAIELAGLGGTNFAWIENQRSLNPGDNSYLNAAGHTCGDMVSKLWPQAQSEDHFILSGGMKDPLQAFSIMQKTRANSLIGIAGGFLNQVLISEDKAFHYIEQFLDGLDFVSQFFEKRS